MSATKHAQKMAPKATLEELTRWISGLKAAMATEKNGMIRSSMSQRIDIYEYEIRKRELDGKAS